MTEPYVSMPVPAKYVPDVTQFLSSLYAAEAGGAKTRPTATGGAQPEEPVADSGIIWTQKQYAALLDKGVISSERAVAFLNALPVGAENRETLPEIAERTGYTYQELKSGLQWLGKFTANPDLFAESVWCFGLGEDVDEDGVKWSGYWFEPNQQEAWQRAVAAYNAA